MQGQSEAVHIHMTKRFERFSISLQCSSCISHYTNSFQLDNYTIV